MGEIIIKVEAKARGLKRYFTGKPCRNGHIAERLTGSGACVQCRAEIELRGQVAYRAKHREALREKGRRWHAANRENIRQRKREDRVTNPERILARERKSYARNLEKIRKRRRQPIHLFQVHKSSAGRRGVPFELTFEQWLKIWQDSGRFQERGNRKNQYVMARYGDIGPYAVGNVRIITALENVLEAKALRAGLEPALSSG
jgi:hypothetical protein